MLYRILVQVYLYYDFKLCNFCYRAYDIQIPDEMKALGLEEYNKPQTPFMTVDCLKRSPNGTIGSVKGTVITVSVYSFFLNHKEF